MHLPLYMETLQKIGVDMTYNILVVEDDCDIVKLLKLYLESQDYRVFTCSNGLKSLEVVENEEIHLALMDIMMPEMDGYELIMRLREEYSFPIIFLSAKTQEVDRIVGLNLGADDYICKPFNPLEVVARVKANLRRANDFSQKKTRQGVYKVQDLILYTEKMVIEKEGNILNLTPMEYKILALFMREPGKVFTKAQIYEEVTGEFIPSDENSIMVHISKIREKIGDDSKAPIYIKNIRGLGYKMVKDD